MKSWNRHIVKELVLVVPCRHGVGKYLLQSSADCTVCSTVIISVCFLILCIRTTVQWKHTTGTVLLIYSIICTYNMNIQIPYCNVLDVVILYIRIQIHTVHPVWIMCACIIDDWFLHFSIYLQRIIYTHPVLIPHCCTVQLYL